MNLLKLKKSGLLLLTALIWGVAFVAQSKGGDAIGPFSFNSVRSLLGSLVLLPVIAILDRVKKTSRKPVNPAEWKLLWKGGILCGIALAFGSSAQQLGIYYGTPVGKAGFLTTCYILIVPILGLFLKKKCGINIWVGIGLACIGLYLLCMNGSFDFQPSDLIILLSALLFSIQIMFVDYYAPKVDGVRLSCIQFLVCGIICAVPAVITEMIPLQGGIITWLSMLSSVDAWVAILYAGVMSCGVAYTLQIVAQDGLNPTLASLLMSFESVFSVLAGWLLLKQVLSLRELIGCAIMFIAIVIAQLRNC